MSGTETEWVCKACGCTEAECECEDFDDVTGCEDFDEIDPVDVFDIEYDR